MNWMTSKNDVWFIPDYLVKIKHYNITRVKNWEEAMSEINKQNA